MTMAEPYRTPLVACSRMYNVTGKAREAWRTLFAWLAERADVALEAIDHPAPAPLDELWSRDDLGCGFICGWPFVSSFRTLQPVAAPIPANERYGGAPVYFTDLVVRRDAGYRRLEDTFGGRLGWTARGSHSGYNALRYHLLPHFQRRKAPLYAATAGSLLTPAGALASVRDGDADIAPLDSYALDLITAHEPERTEGLMVLDSTIAAPIPLLACHGGVDSARRRRLTRALVSASDDAAIRPVLATLQLRGFQAVHRDDYRVLADRAREAVDAGYPEPM